MNNFIMGFVLGFFLGVAAFLLLSEEARSADLGPYITASQWPTYDEVRRARLARAAVKATNPNADQYQTAVHGYDIMRCMDSALTGKAKHHAARQNLFMMLRACADRTRQ